MQQGKNTALDIRANGVAHVPGQQFDVLQAKACADFLVCHDTKLPTLACAPGARGVELELIFFLADQCIRLAFDEHILPALDQVEIGRVVQ